MFTFGFTGNNKFCEVVKIERINAASRCVLVLFEWYECPKTFFQHFFQWLESFAFQIAVPYIK